MRLTSPILNRELLTFLRMKRAFLGMLAFLAILAVAVGICWWASAYGGYVNQRDVLSRTLFHTVTIGQLLIFSAYSLILTSTKINSERDTKTLELLLSAPLSRLHIVLAKYVSALTVMLLLVIASAPFLSLCFLLGGVSWDEVLSVYYIILLAVLTYGMVGMACSTVFRKNYVALMVGFLVAIFFYVGLLLIVVLLVEIWRVPHSDAMTFGLFQTTSPMGPYFTVSILRNFPGGGGPSFALPARTCLVAHTVFQALVFVVSFLIAWLGFRSLTVRTGEPSRRWRFSLRPRRREKAGRSAEALARRKRRYRPIGAHQNPIYVRESRQFFSPRWIHRVPRYLITATAFALVAGMLHESWGNENYRWNSHMIFLAMMTALGACLFSPFLAARMVTSERENNSLWLLVTTPLSPFQIMWGKLAVPLKVAFRTEVLFTFLALFFFRRWPAGGILWLLHDWIIMLVPLFVMTLLWVSTGLLFSVACKRTVTAIVLTYAWILFLSLTVVVAQMLCDILGTQVLGTPGRDAIREILAVVGPVLCPFLYFLDQKQSNYWSDSHQWSTMAGYAVIIATISTGLFLAAVKLFAHKYSTGSRSRA